MTQQPAGRQHPKASEIARMAGSQSDILFSSSAIEAMDRLPDSHLEPVAAAIARIPDGTPDRELAIVAPERPSEHYQVMFPDATDSPIVMYRKLARQEGRGWLVAGLLDPETFNEYENAEGLLGMPGGRHGLLRAELAARALALNMKAFFVLRIRPPLR